ncbi:MAG: hypothetical protein RIU46_07720 [Deltaproteobacteria bacterium]|jgi:hypothetical protein
MEEKRKPGKANWAVIAAVIAAAYLGQCVFFPSGLEYFEKALREGPEAREWLRSNQHPGALASNRFENTEDALKFVDDLYAAGAVRVAVPPDSIRPEPDLGGDYADALVVELPAGLSGRIQLVGIGAAEAARQGMGPDSEWLHGLMYLWWD